MLDLVLVAAMLSTSLEAILSQLGMAWSETPFILSATYTLDWTTMKTITSRSGGKNTFLPATRGNNTSGSFWSVA